VYYWFKNKIKNLLNLNQTKANYKFVLKDWVSLKDLNALSIALESKRFSLNLKPVTMYRPDAARVLIFAPHPDDDVFSSGGTMMHLIRDGCKINVIYLASGSKKTYKNDKLQILDKIAEKLEEETREVSSQIGTNIEFWRFSNRKIVLNEEVLNRVRELYSRIKPEVVFLPFISDDHDDHRRVAQLFYEAFKDFKKLDFEVWAYQVYSTLIPNVVVDISDVMAEKIRLINIWDSVKRQRDWGHYMKGMNAFNSRFLKTNEPRYAECFFVLPAKEYIELSKVYFSHPIKDIYYCDSYRYMK